MNSKNIKGANKNAKIYIGMVMRPDSQFLCCMFLLSSLVLTVQKTIVVYSVQRFCKAAILHSRNNKFFFQWEKVFFLVQSIFIIPAMQHGCRAKPL